MNATRSGTVVGPRFRQLALASLLLLLSVAATWLWAHEGHAPLPTKGSQVDLAKGEVMLSREAREALDVQTAEVATGTVEERLLAYATVTAPWQQHAFASSRLAGRIVKLYVQPGDAVAAGQPLAEVESVELESLQLEVRNAQNDTELWTKLLKGMEEAYQKGGIPEQTLLEAQNKNRQNSNALEIARTRWLSVGLAAADLDTFLREKEARPLRSLPVRSPVRGTVIHADLAVGKVVDPTEHLFEISDLSTVWVQMGVLERDLHRVASGQPLELRLAAYPGEVFQGTVDVTGFYLNPQTHLNTVWATLPNPPGREPRLLPGMAGEAQLLLPGLATGKTIPAEALISDGAEYYVLVEQAETAGGSQYQKRNVVVGRQGNGRVEVRSDALFPGDRVVTRGSHELAAYFLPGVLHPSPEFSRSIGLRVELAGPHVVEDVAQIDGAVDLPSDRRTVASCPLEGTLLKVRVDRGQRVRAGEVLAEVVSPPFQKAQLDLLRSHLDGLLLEDNLRRVRAAGGTTPQWRLLEAESMANANRQLRDSLRRRLQILGLTPEQLDALVTQKKLVEALPVRSPIDGVVVKFDRVLGQTVKAEEPFLEIHDLTKPLIQGFVAERDLSRVRIGQKVRVRLTADPDFLGEGTVVRSARVFKPETRTLSVWVELDQKPVRPLLYNQAAHLTLTLDRPAPTPLAVPLTAVVYEGVRPFVFLQEADGTFRRQPVETGRADDRRVEITRGLRPGDRAAVGGVTDLQTAYAVIR